MTASIRAGGRGAALLFRRCTFVSLSAMLLSAAGAPAFATDVVPRKPHSQDFVGTGNFQGSPGPRLGMGLLALAFLGAPLLGEVTAHVSATLSPREKAQTGEIVLW